MTIDARIKEAVANALDSDAIKESIEEHCNNAIDSVIKDAFNYSSEFRKSLKAKVESVMPVLDETDLAVFVNAVRHVTQSRLVRLADEQAQKTIGKMLDELLPNGDVITIEDLEVSFRERCDIDEDEYQSDWDEIYYLWKFEADKKSNGFFNLLCSKNAGASSYSSETTTLRFKIDEDGLLNCWHVRMGNVDVPKDSPFVGPLYGFDAMVFRLYVGTAKLRVK